MLSYFWLILLGLNATIVVPTSKSGLNSLMPPVTIETSTPSRLAPCCDWDEKNKTSFGTKEDGVNNLTQIFPASYLTIVPLAPENSPCTVWLTIIGVAPFPEICIV